MEPKILQLPGLRVVGLSITTRPFASEIPALWGKFAPRMREVTDLAEPRVSYGIMENLDAAQSQLDYMAAVSVLNFDHVPSGMVIKSIEASTYAVFEASLSTLNQAFTYIFSTWSQHTVLQHIRGPYFERYGESFDPTNPNSKVDIYIPVNDRNVER